MEQVEVKIETDSFGVMNSGQVTGNIRIQGEGWCFPSEGWNDFVAVVLGWWIESLKRLESTGESEFMFMDGPHTFRISLNDDDPVLILYPNRREGSRLMFDPSFFKLSLDDAATAFVAKCDSEGWGNDDIEVLKARLEI